jgi:MFS family permease
LPFIGLGFFGTLCWIHSNNLFSQAVTENEQGLIFGVSQALWAFASIFGSIMVGFCAAAHYTFSVIVPIFFGLLACILAIILVFIIEKKQPIEAPIILF